MSAPEPAPALPSATVVLLRDNRELEVLLVQRNAKIRFHGGAWVFPGGKVEAVDLPDNAKTIDAISEPQRQGVYRKAALRETKEEAGITLSEADLHPCSSWLTPVELPKRFLAWFYLCKCPDQAIRIDHGEIKAHQWITPTKALEQHQAKQLDLPPSTFVTLHHLARHTSANSAINTLSKNPLHFRPRLLTLPDGVISFYQEDAGYINLDAHISGKRHRLIKRNSRFKYVRHT